MRMDLVEVNKLLFNKQGCIFGCVMSWCEHFDEVQVYTTCFLRSLFHGMVYTK